MDSIDELETVCADAWPPLVETRLGDWRLRAAGGYTGRANSALICGSPGVRTPVALDTVVEFASRHGIRPYAQVVTGSRWEAEFAAAGWAVNLAHPKGAESAVLTSPLVVAGPGAEVFSSLPAEWPAAGELTAAQRHVLTSGPKVGFATVRGAGRVVGVARGCVVGEWLHISVLEVEPEWRGRGLGRFLLAGLDVWGAEAGAVRRVLQVSVDNVGALGLYAGLGYRRSHCYRYWGAS
ncbi:GNAT family N-acetyltransferase [Actinokineospora iranica]|uniref:GNAT family N-acetyltransferase n=1 Tax=Actinokineospora iranica TaxID=1271860 RepID=UPI000B83F9BC|nr:GNAT family N-acetyltransferase [Actinokineospora iranica]